MEETCHSHDVDLNVTAIGSQEVGAGICVRQFGNILPGMFALTVTGEFGVLGDRCGPSTFPVALPRVCAPYSQG